MVCKSTRTLGSPLYLLKMWGNSLAKQKCQSEGRAADMKLNKKIFVILVSLLFTFLCGCTQNTQFEPTEQPHLYWKDIIVYVTVRSDEYQLTYTDEFAGSGAFGYPEQGNYRKGDIVKAEMYSWVMDSTGEIVRQEILMNRGLRSETK